MKLYLKLKEVRESKGFTQKELAEKIGIDFQSISRYERNLSNPTMERAMQIATVLECTLNDLVDIERYMKDYHDFLYNLSLDSKN